VIAFLLVLVTASASTAQQCAAGDADTVANAFGGMDGMALGWPPSQVRGALRDELRSLHYDLRGDGSDSAGLETKPSYRFPEEPGVEAFRRYKHPGVVVRAYVRPEVDSSRLFVFARAVCKVAEPPPAGYPVPVESSLELMAAQEVAFGTVEQLRRKHPRRLVIPKGPLPPQVLEEARAQIRARRLDSAATLLRAVTTSSLAETSDLAEAYMWLGVVSFYKAQDSATRTAFREAVRNKPLMAMGPRLAQLDSSLAELWENEQTIAVCGELLPVWGWPFGRSPSNAPINATARAGIGPEIVSAPAVHYPDQLRRAGIQGRVIVRVLVDAQGRTEKGSARILESAHSGFNDVVIQYMERAQFRAAAASTGPVRSCVVIPVDFTIKY
jgi:TonB family protein